MLDYPILYKFVGLEEYSDVETCDNHLQEINYFANMEVEN